MSRHCLQLALLLSAMTAASCAGELDIPPAPDFEDVLAAYAHPSAEVSSTVMAAVGDQLLELRERIQDSRFLDEILEIIFEVQIELDRNTDENGNLVIGGLGTFPTPNAVIELDHACTGWNPTSDEPQAEDSGSVALTMVLELGDISPVVWGEATQCEFLASFDDTTLQSAYDGGIAVHFGEDPIPTGDPLRDLAATFVLSGTLELDGEQIPVRRSVRLLGQGGLEILWELDDGTSFVYLFNPGTLGQGIRDANCTGSAGCSCNLEERRCTLPSGSISW